MSENARVENREEIESPFTQLTFIDKWCAKNVRCNSVRPLSFSEECGLLF